MKITRVLIIISLVFLLPTVSFAELDYYTSKYISRDMEIGDPISASSGELFFRMDFLNLGGPLPLNYSLNYRLDGKHCGDFFFVNDPHIVKSGDVRVLSYGQDANMLDFDSMGGGNYKIVGSPVIYQLKETGPDEEHGYYYLMDPMNELVYIFKKDPDQYDADDLMWIMDRNGNTLTYTRDASKEDRITGISDGLGRTLTFSYNASAELETVTDHCGRTVTYTNDNNINYDCPAGVTDPAGGKTEFIWSSKFNDAELTGIKRPEGNIPYTWAYDETMISDNRWVVSQTDAYGNTTNILYSSDPDGNCPPEVTEQRPDSSEVIYDHTCGNDSYGPPDFITDAGGNTIDFTPADTWKDSPITSITDRMGDTTSFTYHPETGRIASVTDAEGRTTTYTYTPQDQTFTNPENNEQVTFTFYNLTQITYPDGSTEQFGYDAKGNVISRTDTSGSVWTYTYNSMGLVLTETNPMGGITYYTYNPDGTLSSMRRSDIGQPTTYGYDSCKRLTSINYPDGTSTTFVLDNMDRTLSVTYPGNRTFTYEYDSNGNLTTYTDPLNNSITYSYDLMDRLTGVTDKLGKTTAYSYDVLGRIDTTTHADGSKTNYTYNYMDELTGLTLQGGNTWNRGYDKEGIPLSDSAPGGGTTTYESNKLGFITARTDPLGNRVEYGFDNLYRMTSFTDPLGNSIQYAWDSADHLSGITMPVRGSALYVRNALGAITKITDPLGNEWRFEYNNHGRLERHIDPLNNTYEYGYNASTGVLETITYPDGTVLTYTYDQAGNITQKSYSTGLTLTYTYDALRRLTSTGAITMTYNQQGRITNTVSSSRGFGATYDDLHQLKTVTYDNGAFTVTYTYDANGLLTRVEDSLTSSWVEFLYDSDGRNTGIRRSNNLNASFIYDSAGRLTGLQDGGIIDIQYTLDDTGRVTSAQATLPLNIPDYLTDQTHAYSYDGASRISTTGYQYDAVGRMTQGDGFNFTYDAEGRVTEISDGTNTTALTYDGVGALISRSYNGTTTNYFYNRAIDYQPIVAEQDASTGNILRYYVWTPYGTLLYMIDASDNNRVYFYHFDDTGSTLALSDPAGTVTDRYAYTPYGILLRHEGTNPQPFTYSGQWGVRQEGDTGTIYQIRARYYSARSARFISRDPDWPTINSLPLLNPYQYANQNPLMYSDITGMKPSKNREGDSDPCQQNYKKKLADLEDKIKYQRFLVDFAFGAALQMMNFAEKAEQAAESWGFLNKGNKGGVVMTMKKEAEEAAESLVFWLKKLAEAQAELDNLLAQKAALLRKMNRAKTPCEDSKKPRRRCRKAIVEKGADVLPSFPADPSILEEEVCVPERGGLWWRRVLTWESLEELEERICAAEECFGDSDIIFPLP